MNLMIILYIYILVIPIIFLISMAIPFFVGTTDDKILLIDLGPPWNIKTWFERRDIWSNAQQSYVEHYALVRSPWQLFFASLGIALIWPIVVIGIGVTLIAYCADYLLLKLYRVK